MPRIKVDRPDPTDVRGAQLDALAVIQIVIRCEVDRIAGESDCRADLPITTGSRDALAWSTVVDPTTVVDEVRAHVERRHPELQDHLRRLLDRGRTDKWNAVHLDLLLDRLSGRHGPRESS